MNPRSPRAQSARARLSQTLRGVVAALAIVISTGAVAQSVWPTKPVRVMVGANPGGGQ